MVFGPATSNNSLFIIQYQLLSLHCNDGYTVGHLHLVTCSQSSPVQWPVWTSAKEPSHHFPFLPPPYSCFLCWCSSFPSSIFNTPSFSVLVSTAFLIESLENQFLSPPANPAWLWVSWGFMSFLSFPEVRIRIGTEGPSVRAVYSSRHQVFRRCPLYMDSARRLSAQLNLDSAFNILQTLRSENTKHLSLKLLECSRFF